eukprot:TRINITY_DN3125_c0_g1_i2.p1 TRINITY_DN3125_c0_g1~~TRINITY_DN3125_c0_g1_i2.p1  ORF type:complete len:116 (+),score=5.96 TRINITY_DN3125_c0_g1_i2:45-392(+)
MTYAGGALPPHTFVVGPTAPHLQQGFPTAFGRQPAQHGSRGAYQPRGGGANNFRGGRGKRKGDYGHAHRRGGPSGGRPIQTPGRLLKNSTTWMRAAMALTTTMHTTYNQQATRSK